jgi:uncharacterized protein YbaR (Trm112 family)
MVLPEKLLEKLVCPKCRGKLEYLADKDRLVCGQCQLAYRIKDNIPVLLVDEAEKL